ncbi:hypothetical protein B0H13DRAFT_1929838 [Mycena leptocephala]|nr:hypothetical protein B0H13DRAFT_1929838 [Mycena leptocephala]
MKYIGSRDNTNKFPSQLTEARSIVLGAISCSKPLLNPMAEDESHPRQVQQQLTYYIPLRLPVEIAGPTPDPTSYIYVSSERRELDLDFCTYTRIVRVGPSGADSGFEFVRSTCYQFLPQPPRSAEDFIIPPIINTAGPINKYILPPMDIETALAAVACAPGPSESFTIITIRRGPWKTCFRTDRIPRQESFIDLYFHQYDVFCAVFLREGGIYEAVSLYSSDGYRIIWDRTLIFAPSAWVHGAEVLANRGSVSGDKTRLLCRLQCGDLVTLDVESIWVGIEEGWTRE